MTEPQCDGVGIRRTVRYQVRLRDLASFNYRSLGWSRWKPAVFASARLTWLAELCVMSAMPGVTLGVLQVVRHLSGTVRGTWVTVTAECTERRGSYWEWNVVVRDPEQRGTQQVIARCTLGFVADIDVERYRRRLAVKRAARPASVVWRLRILDALAVVSVAVIPVQVAYAWHNWLSILAVETALIVGRLLTLTGLHLWVSDWLTVRPVLEDDCRPQVCDHCGRAVDRLDGAPVPPALVLVPAPPAPPLAQDRFRANGSVS